VAHSVILATQEAEIRSIAVQSQPRQSLRDPISKKPFTKKGWWAGDCELNSCSFTTSDSDTGLLSGDFTNYFHFCKITSCDQII
jgi:hypothetical protein